MECPIVNGTYVCVCVTIFYNKSYFKEVNLLT